VQCLYVDIKECNKRGSQTIIPETALDGQGRSIDDMGVAKRVVVDLELDSPQPGLHASVMDGHVNRVSLRDIPGFCRVLS
jgi:hypothetical protein